ncbi:type II secretion system F family protein [Acetobacterium carbinolicum]|uniref:type II secretion system F family protein n=1 Tax=Acetobacterium TaxID=33951 RepID=UPI000DBEBA17|nr:MULTISPECIES: type II secretion system F family protein [unclassified Acetobacterium]AWW25705.1 secretion system protein [Acetobacterium sp. KB-1]MDZ5724661.1 type II secretion system F family protein [Acetobacterium sp. K1/6]
MNAIIVTLLIMITIFFLVLLLLYAISADQRQMQKRFEAMTSEGNSDLENLKKVKRNRDKSKHKVLKKLGNDLSMSGILIRPSEFLLFWLVLTVVPSTLLFMLGANIIFVIIVLVFGLLAPPLYVNKKRAKRVELFEQQLIDAISIMSSCLKAGLTFQQALVSISTEMPNPISEEFGRVVKELKLGSSIETALTRLSDKIGSQNFMMIVSAILIQRQTGGNLSEILTNISGTIKERFKIKNEIKVLTATARTSGLVVGLMPVVIILVFMLFNPDYVTIFFESNLGIAMVIVAMVLELIGYLLIRKIVNIKF